METCNECGYPLILQTDNPDDDPAVWEDDNGGLCGNCVA